MIIKLSDHVKLRPQQYDWFRAYFVDRKRFFLTAAHRRFGKGVAAFMQMICAATEIRGIYGYFLPTISQSRKVIWQTVGEEGIKLLERIPKRLIAKVNHSEQMINLINGSIIYVSGSDNFERWVGMNFRYIVFDEAQDTNMAAWDAMRPMITRNKGFTHFLGTPRAFTTFKDLYEEHVHDPEWFVTNLTINDTYDQFGQRIITEEDIEAERRNQMPEELIQQEYFGNWNATIRGAYFTEQMFLAHKENRIGRFPHNPNYPVYTGMDLGFDDDTSVWCIQVYDAKVFLIDYFEYRQKGIIEYANQIQIRVQKHKWRMATQWAPHDAANNHAGSGKSAMMIAREYGIQFRLVERPQKKIHGIQAIRHMFRRFHFDATACKLGLKHLSEYRPAYDDTNNVYSLNPLRNSATHGADALQTFCMGWMRAFEFEDYQRQTKYANLYGMHY